MKEVKYILSTKLIGFKKFALELSKIFDCDIHLDENYRINLPVKVGNGYMQFWELESGLSIANFNIRFNEDAFISNRPTIETIYLLRFISFDTNAFYSISETHEFEIKNKYGITSFWSSSHFSGRFYCPANIWIKGVWLAFDKEWLINNAFGTGIFDSEEEQKIIKNEPMKKAMDLGSETLKIVEENFHAEQNENQSKILLKGKAFLLLSSFLKQSREKKIEKTISPKDAITVMTFTGNLKNNIHKPWPKVKDAAEICLLSQSKFIRVFNRIYKKNYYEYYTELRMEKAAEGLNQGYSVFETATNLGFQNVSHFTREFKKYFLIEPSHYNNNK